jgi:hypothetical protein
VKVTRRLGRLRLRLEPAEVHLLTMLFDELDALLDTATGPDDPVLNRLFPSAYLDDTEAEVEFRSLTETTLRGDRVDRIDACRADLEHGAEIELSEAEDAQRWIQVLNDLRLALGTRLGVSEDDEHDFDPTDPEAQPWVVYHWLTAVQDSVVHGLMR